MTRNEAIAHLIDIASRWAENAEEAFPRRLNGTDSDDDLTQVLKQTADDDHYEVDDLKEVRDVWKAIDLLQAELPKMDESGKRAVRFTFTDDDVWDGFADGSTWNGFDNIWITPETRDAVVARWRDEGGEAGEISALMNLPVENGLVCLGWGYATSIWDEAKIKAEIARIGRA